MASVSFFDLIPAETHDLIIGHLDFLSCRSLLLVSPKWNLTIKSAKHHFDVWVQRMVQEQGTELLTGAVLHEWVYTDLVTDPVNQLSEETLGMLMGFASDVFADKSGTDVQDLIDIIKSGPGSGRLCKFLLIKPNVQVAKKNIRVRPTILAPLSDYISQKSPGSHNRPWIIIRRSIFVLLEVFGSEPVVKQYLEFVKSIFIKCPTKLHYLNLLWNTSMGRVPGFTGIVSDRLHDMTGYDIVIFDTHALKKLSLDEVMRSQYPDLYELYLEMCLEVSFVGMGWNSENQIKVKHYETQLMAHRFEQQMVNTMDVSD